MFVFHGGWCMGCIVCALWGVDVPMGVYGDMVWQRRGGGDGTSAFNAGDDN